MTQLFFKNKIDDLQMAILLHLLKSWNVEAEVRHGETVSVSENRHKPFAKTRGMWKDYDIDAKQLRREAWGTNKL